MNTDGGKSVTQKGAEARSWLQSYATGLGETHPENGLIYLPPVPSAFVSINTTECRKIKPIFPNDFGKVKTFKNN